VFCGTLSINRPSLISPISSVYSINDKQFIDQAEWHDVTLTCSFYGRTEFVLRLDNKSRMSREVPVRFRESLGEQFRLLGPNPSSTRSSYLIHRLENAA